MWSISRHLVVFVPVLLAATACRTTSGDSDTKTFRPGQTFQGNIETTGTGRGFAVWVCKPNLDATAEFLAKSGQEVDDVEALVERDFQFQDEYCEWRKTTLLPDKKLVCQFTTNLEGTGPGRDFFLRQDNNNLGAAITLVNDCTEEAKRKLAAGGTDVGTNCEGNIQNGCVKTRTSDPSICNEVRKRERNNAQFSRQFTIADLDPKAVVDLKKDPDRPVFSAMPLMKLFPTQPMPAGCAYGTLADGRPDIRRVNCEIKPQENCVTKWAGIVEVGLGFDICDGPCKNQAGAKLTSGGESAIVVGGIGAQDFPTASITRGSGVSRAVGGTADATGGSVLPAGRIPTPKDDATLPVDDGVPPGDEAEASPY